MKAILWTASCCSHSSGQLLLPGVPFVIWSPSALRQHLEEIISEWQQPDGDRSTIPNRSTRSAVGCPLAARATGKLWSEPRVSTVTGTRVPDFALGEERCSTSPLTARPRVQCPQVYKFYIRFSDVSRTQERNLPGAETRDTKGETCARGKRRPKPVVRCALCGRDPVP